MCLVLCIAIFTKVGGIANFHVFPMVTDQREHSDQTITHLNVNNHIKWENLLKSTNCYFTMRRFKEMEITLELGTWCTGPILIVCAVWLYRHSADNTQ